MKRKFITQEEFENIATKEWTLIILVQSFRPNALKTLPNDITFCCVGSASVVTSNPYEDRHKYLDNQIGGLDVVRYGEDGVLLDVDWYRILDEPDAQDMPEDCRYLLDGPYKYEGEHHLDEIPRKYEDAVTKNLSNDKK